MRWVVSSAEEYLIRRGRLWGHVDDHFRVLVLISVLRGARRAHAWRLQAHPAAERQHQAHRQAQQEHHKAHQQQQLRIKMYAEVRPSSHQ